MTIKRCVCALLAAALCLCLCACGEGEPPKPEDALNIWYTDGDAPAYQLAALAGDYAAAAGSRPVSMRRFEDEESLAAALDSARPDLLLCSLQKAAELYDRGLLKDISAAMPASPEYAEDIASRCAGIGRSIFPLGCEVQLLYTTPGLFEAGAPDTMAELLTLAANYGRDTGLPFFTADSFGDLIYQAMLASGEELHGERDRDINNEAYISAYNALAEAAFHGGLALTKYSARELVDSGYLPCAAARSSSLVGLSADAAITPLPIDGEDGSRLANCLCIAVTAPEGRSVSRIVHYLGWLTDSARLSALALDSGLVPAVKNASPVGESALTGALMKLYDSCPLHLPDGGADYLTNRAEYENELRGALEALQ